MYAIEPWVTNSPELQAIVDKLINIDIMKVIFKVVGNYNTIITLFKNATENFKNEYY